MPLYEYQCELCAKRFERIQKYSDPLVETCPSCGGPVRKLFSSPAIQFKGSGWYITDYASKKPSTDAGSKSEDSKADNSKPSTDSSSPDTGASAPAADTSAKTEKSAKKD